MLRIYLVRHGQTPCSVANVLCGQCDAALTPLGVQTAQALAAALAPQRWSALYSSPLRRAQQSLAPLAQATDLAVTTLPGLAEIDFGRWDGQSSAALQARDPDFSTWVQRPAQLRAPGGESGEMVLARAKGALAWVRTRHDAGQVLLMTHKTTLRLLLCDLTGEPTDRYRQRFDQPLGAVNIIDFSSSGIHLRSVGDISYQRGTC